MNREYGLYKYCVYWVQHFIFFCGSQLLALLPCNSQVEWRSGRRVWIVSDLSLLFIFYFKFKVRSYFSEEKNFIICSRRNLTDTIFCEQQKKRKKLFQIETQHILKKDTYYKISRQTSRETTSK